MASSVFVLDESREWFLRQGRIDPMTRAQYQKGDRVVVCGRCRMVSLETTWNDCGGCTSPGCGGKVAASRFLKAPAPKMTVHPAAINQIVLRNGRVERQAMTPSEAESDGGPRMIIKVRRMSD